MQIPHQVYKIDLNNINEPITRMIESVNDKGVRYVDVELWANSQRVNLSEDCNATAAFVTDGFLINESIECAISDDLTTVIVPIDNAKIKSKSGIMLVEIKITDESGNILTPPFAFKVRVKKSVTEDANIFEKSYGTVSEILKEVADARGNSKTLKDEIAKKADVESVYTKTEVDTKLSGKADKSTTLAGYGITDAYTKTEVDTALNKKPDKSTTLAGYGINDGENSRNKVSDKSEITDDYANYPSINYLKGYYYDYNEVDEALLGKLDNASGAVKTDNIANKVVTSDKLASSSVTSMKIANNAVAGNHIAQYQIGTAHLMNGIITTEKLADKSVTISKLSDDLLNCIKTSSGTGGGKSAYDIALEHGFIGSEEDWLKSLKGADGAKGDKGEYILTNEDKNEIAEIVMSKIADGSEVSY